MKRQHRSIVANNGLLKRISARACFEVFSDVVGSAEQYIMGHNSCQCRRRYFGARAMKKLVLLFVLLASIFALMPGTTSAASSLET